MPVHVHGCPTCRPDMVPDFDRADARYHAYETCGRVMSVTLDGETLAYTKGAFEGAEGWALFAGANIEALHDCPTCTTRDAEGFVVNRAVCVEPRFGRVEIRHEEAA